MEFLRKLWRCLFCWRVTPDDWLKLAEADVVVALSFGGREDGQGKSNEALAEAAFRASRLNDVLRLPLVLQWEISFCFPWEGAANVIYRPRHFVKYLDTREALVQARWLCQYAKHSWYPPGKVINRPWNKTVIVAHPDHLWRAMRAAEKIGFEVMAADTASVPYDKESKQWWTRGRGRFIAREIPTRIYYLFKGWI